MSEETSVTEGLRLDFTPGFLGLHFKLKNGDKYLEQFGPRDMAYVNGLIEADEKRRLAKTQYSGLKKWEVSTNGREGEEWEVYIELTPHINSWRYNGSNKLRVDGVSFQYAKNSAQIICDVMNSFLGKNCSKTE